MTTKLYEVQEFNLCGGWINNWSDENGPSYFESREAAQNELDSFLADCEQDFKEGFMPDYPDREEFRIVELRGQ